MPRLPAVLQKLRLPLIGAPLFLISNPQLVIAQCQAGIVGSVPALNARPAAQRGILLPPSPIDSDADAASTAAFAAQARTIVETGKQPS